MPPVKQCPLPAAARRVPRGMVAVLAALLSVTGCRGAAGAPRTAPVAGEPAQPLSGATASTTGVAPAVAGARQPAVPPEVVFDSAWAIVGRTHWDTTFNGVDWRAVRDTLRPQAAAATSDSALRTVLNGLIGRLQQSHFSIIPREAAGGSAPTDAAAGRGNGSPGSADGVGEAGLALRWLDSALVVLRVDPGSAAEDAGVRAGWVLESVDDVPVASVVARRAVHADARRAALMASRAGEALLTGAVGTTRRLALRDGAGALRSVPVVLRAPPGTLVAFGNLPPIQAALAVERRVVAGRRVGVIRFNVWMPVLARQFDLAVDSLRDADGIVLDLRGNPGGVGGMAMGIAGHFLDSTVLIGTMQQRAATMRFVANPRRVDAAARPVRPYAGPLALVVDELSASTTEIFVAGLQEARRGRVFGVTTAGQALPAVAERLPNGDILYHAVADFRTPSGKALEGAGVTPDQVVPVSRAALLRGEDAALEAALRWAGTPDPRRAVP